MFKKKNLIGRKGFKLYVTATSPINKWTYVSPSSHPINQTNDFGGDKAVQEINMSSLLNKSIF